MVQNNQPPFTCFHPSSIIVPIAARFNITPHTPKYYTYTQPSPGRLHPPEEITRGVQNRRQLRIAQRGGVHGGGGVQGVLELEACQPGLRAVDGVTRARIAEKPSEHGICIDRGTVTCKVYSLVICNRTGGGTAMASLCVLVLIFFIGIA